MFCAIYFRTTASGQERKDGKKENKDEDEQKGATDLLPPHPRVKQNDHGNGKEE
jgi:hypothetical protein